MKKIKRIRDKIVLHPIMSFLILILITIVVSGILSLFDITGTYSTVNTKTNSLETTMVAVENLFSLRGLKYIFSNTVSNFASFMHRNDKTSVQCTDISFFHFLKNQISFHTLPQGHLYSILPAWNRLYIPAHSS